MPLDSAWILRRLGMVPLTLLTRSTGLEHSEGNLRHWRERQHHYFPLVCEFSSSVFHFYPFLLPATSKLFWFGCNTQLIWDNKTQVFHQVHSSLENIQHLLDSSVPRGASLSNRLSIICLDTEVKILNALILQLQISSRTRKQQMQHMPQFVFPILVKKIASVAAGLPASAKELTYWLGGLNAPTTLIQAETLGRGKKHHKFMYLGRMAVPWQGRGSKGSCSKSHPLSRKPYF